MGIKKKCNWCEKTTDKSREDFDEIGWSGVQIGNNKMICACQNHFDELSKYIMEKARKVSP